MGGLEASDSLTERLQTLLVALRSRQAIHHAVAAVESEDRSLRWFGAVGDAQTDGVRMRATTPYFIASVDKLFTATAVLKLCERGQIVMDGGMEKYLARSSIEGLHRLHGVDYTSKITIRHLLSHTSGLPDWLVDRPRHDSSMLQRIVEGGDFSMSLDELIDIVRSQLTPHFPPQPLEARRQKVRYSDTNFMLLIAIIEAVTGRQLHEVYAEFFFKPLALKHTWLAGWSKPTETTTEPAQLWVKDKPLEIPLLMRSIRAIYSTVADNLSFMRALIDGTVFENPSTFGSMQRRWNRFGVPLDLASLQLPSWPLEYGLGVMRFEDPLLRFLLHLPHKIVPIYPAPVIGHTGSTGSWLFYCPTLKLMLSGTVDQANAGALPYRLIPKILGIVHRHIEEVRY